MNISRLLSRFALCYALGSAPVALSAETFVLDFESASTGLEFPGVAFEDVEVISGKVSSSSGVILPTAPSGTKAGFGSGARIRFSIPVIKVSLLVSPSFISVPLRRVTQYFTVWLCAYGEDGSLITKSTAPMFAAVADPELLSNFTPSVISVSTAVPIAELTIDLSDPYDNSGSTFYIDDLTVTVQEQLPLIQPTLRIEAREGGRAVMVVWDIPSAQFEQSPSLGTPAWQPVPTDRMYIRLDTGTNAAMFFRVVRPTQ